MLTTEPRYIVWQTLPTCDACQSVSCSSYLHAACLPSICGDRGILGATPSVLAPLTEASYYAPVLSNLWRLQPLQRLHVLVSGSFRLPRFAILGITMHHTPLGVDQTYPAPIHARYCHPCTFPYPFSIWYALVHLRLHPYVVTCPPFTGWSSGVSG